MTKNFVAIGGGAGMRTMATTLRALKEARSEISVTALITSGVPDDAIQDDVARAGDAFEKRAATLAETKEILGDGGTAMHLTPQMLNLAIWYERGDMVHTQTAKPEDRATREAYGRITAAAITGSCAAYDAAIEAIAAADAVFFGPGDFIEILPGFLVPGVRETIRQKHRHPAIVLIPPLMSRCAQGLSVRDFLWETNRFCGRNIITHAFINTGMPESLQIQHYGIPHGAYCVDGASLNIPTSAILVRDDLVLKNLGASATLTPETMKIRHDPRAILSLIEKFVIQNET